MGTSGPGNIVHIDNLYVKTLKVLDNVSIVIGDYCVYDSTTDFIRPVVAGDFSADDTFLDLTANQIFQAGENANNLSTTEPLLRKNLCECILVGSDWTTKMSAGVRPTQTVGILRVDSDAINPFQIAHQSVATTVVAVNEKLGKYNHKEFSTVAEISALSDDGVISTGVMTN